VSARDRPDMPAEYGLHTTAEGLLDWDWVEERLVAAPNYWIASTRADGAPHVAPVWGTWVDGALWFGTDPDSVKARNLARDPRAAMHLESGDECVIAHGAVASVEVATLAPALAARIDDGFAAKYVDPGTGGRFRPLSGMPPDAAVLRLVPGTVLAWLEHDFPATATRWHLDD
jgi:hypothetical protein